MWGRNIYDSIRKFLQFQLTVNVVATLVILVGAAILRQSVLTVVQLLWVNLIMDTLGALALATEPPKEELLLRKPHGKNEYIVSRKMMKHIISQAIYQITVIMVIIFAGDYFIPEYLTPKPDLPASVIWSPHTNGDQHYVRSGRLYMINGEDPDYLNLQDQYGPSRHFTMVFNAFVVLQIFNFFNCRKLNDELNIFSGLFKSRMFCIIVLIIIGGQLILGNLGGRALYVSFHAMDIRQWLIAVAFGFGSWVLAFLVKFLPSKVCFRAGKAEADPFQEKSIIIGLRRSQENKSLQRKFSNPANLPSNSVRSQGSARNRKHDNSFKIEFHNSKI